MNLMQENFNEERKKENPIGKVHLARRDNRPNIKKRSNRLNMKRNFNCYYCENQVTS